MNHASHLNHSSTVDCQKILVNDICDLLEPIEYTFDYIVVSGVSGLLVGPVIAYLLDKQIVVVRKTKGDHSTHTVEFLPEETDFSYLILDDLVCSGDTLKRMVRQMPADSTCVSVLTYYYGLKLSNLDRWFDPEDVTRVR